MRWLRIWLVVGLLMATNLNQIITMGVGTPGGISQIVLFGLSPTPVVDAYVARPDSEVSNAGSWDDNQGVGLYAALDEKIADDIDYIMLWQPPYGSQRTCELGLSDVTLPAAGDTQVIMWVRARRSLATNVANLTVSLYQGSTLIAQLVPTLTTSFADYNYTLTAAQMTSITDYADLRVRFAGIVSALREIHVSYFALMIYQADAHRIYSVPLDDRSYATPSDLRIYTVPVDDRTMVVS